MIHDDFWNEISDLFEDMNEEEVVVSGSEGEEEREEKDVTDTIVNMFDHLHMLMVNTQFRAKDEELEIIIMAILLFMDMAEKAYFRIKKSRGEDGLLDSGHDDMPGRLHPFNNYRKHFQDMVDNRHNNRVTMDYDWDYPDVIERRKMLREHYKKQGKVWVSDEVADLRIAFEEILRIDGETNHEIKE